MASPTSNTLLGDVADLVRAVGSLLWPLVAGYVVVNNEKQLRELLSRLRKGKLLGQEIELDSSLKELEQQATVAAAETALADNPRQPPLTEETDRPEEDEAPMASERDEEFQRQILLLASQSPTVALIQLASGIERLANEIWDDFDDGTSPRRPSVYKLTESLAHILPPSVPKAIRTFWNVRNHVVHGRDAESAAIISAVDSGLSLWRSLRDFTRSYVEVLRSQLPIFDDDGTQIPDGTAVEIRHKDTGKVELWPTTRRDYKPRMMVRPAWNFDKKFGRTRYRDPMTGELIKIFDASADFVGEPIKALFTS